jgi:nitrogen fixation NifU-like protein
VYNDIIMDHFSDPRNVGEMTDASAIGETGNPVDGDKIKIFIKVKDKVLVDIKFKTFGCGAAIAASSMVTLLAINKTLEQALNIQNEDVSEALGGLPAEKLICSNIAADALHNAIKNYLSMQGL